jgi:NADPH:quinone reductase-like Zn-dependent oxidoreductase
MKMNKHHYVAKEKGGPEVLSWQAFKPAAPGKGEISVSAETAGVLLADVLWQMGITPIGPKPPFTPGYDIVGTIEAIGPGVSGLQA